MCQLTLCQRETGLCRICRKRQIFDVKDIILIKTTDFIIDSITGASQGTGMRLVSSEAGFSVVFVNEKSSFVHFVTFIQQCLNAKVRNVGHWFLWQNTVLINTPRIETKKL